MAQVSPNDTGTEDESFVDLLPLRERATLKHQRFLTSEECL
jgi:hypothetical protein